MPPLSVRSGAILHATHARTQTHARATGVKHVPAAPVSLCLDMAPIFLSHAQLALTRTCISHVLSISHAPPPCTYMCSSVHANPHRPPSNLHPSVPLALLPLQGPHSNQRCVRARQTRVLRRPHRRTRQWCDHSPALPRRAHCRGHRARPGSGQRGTAGRKHAPDRRVCKFTASICSPPPTLRTY